MLNSISAPVTNELVGASTSSYVVFSMSKRLVFFLHGCEWRFGGPRNDCAVWLEARSVTGTIPRPLGLVPIHEATHVRADRGATIEAPDSSL